MKKVLIITYYWPPAGGIGVHRFLKMARYLPEFGWEPIILTPENGSYPYLDYSLEKEIPEHIEVFRTPVIEPFRWYNFLRGKKGKQVEVAVIGWNSKKTLFQKFSEFIRANIFIPDARVGWYPYAVNEAERIIKKYNPEVIITTGPPHSAHLIGLRLKRKFNIPWIADMRDPWTRIFYNFQLPRTCLTRWLDAYLENTVLKNASRISVIGPGMKKHFGSVSYKADVIFNGYDKTDFSQTPPLSADKFIIRYVGNMKANDDIPAFWRALRKLYDEPQGFAENARLIITGRIDPKAMDEITKNNLSSFIEKEGFVDHSEAVKRMQHAHLLLFSVPVTPDGELYITGKIFEYIGADCPVLGVGPVGGDADKILQQAGLAGLIDYDNENEIYERLLRAFSEWKVDNRMIRNNQSGRSFFTRKKQTEILAGILCQLTSKG